MGKNKTPKHISMPSSVEKFKGVKKGVFVSSLRITEHPLINSRKKIKLLYFTVLEHLVNICAYPLNTDYANARLLEFRNLLVNTETASLFDKKYRLLRENINNTVKKLVHDFFKPWKRKYCVMFLCDIAIIILDKAAAGKSLDIMARYLGSRKRKRLYELFEMLYNKSYSDSTLPPEFVKVTNMAAQFYANRDFVARQEMRILVTANISAGKSTLINAIVGKPVTKAVQEACTSRLCFLYNKPFEDNHIHLLASSLNLNATYDELRTAEKEAVCSIASFFRVSGRSQIRVCLIDTPGVNSAVNRDHGILTRKAIVEETYDKLIYVLNANVLGTDDEIRHLKYVYENVPGEKVIFVLNKLDDFKKTEDSISGSIEGVKRDLQKIGFKNPVICPFSAYFSLLLKMKLSNDNLSHDEQDIFDLFVKKFNKPEYDLSAYYDKTYMETLKDKYQTENVLIKMGIISGLYGFEETVLYGGTKQ